MIILYGGVSNLWPYELKDSQGFLSQMLDDELIMAISSHTSWLDCSFSCDRR